jgi:hypothetical protein
MDIPYKNQEPTDTNYHKFYKNMGTQTSPIEQSIPIKGVNCGPVRI